MPSGARLWQDIDIQINVNYFFWWNLKTYLLLERFQNLIA